jgi:RNA polymerase sigma-70 factor (ECF subfamily)
MIYRFPGLRTEKPKDDADQFNAALLAELPRLRRYAIALVGDLALADDLVQDSAERALRRRMSLIDHGRLYAWLRSILHNLCVDAVRQRRRRGVHVDLEDMAEILTTGNSTAERAAAIDLTRAMAGLSIEHRQIMLLVGLEGLSYREVADELGIPVGTVMSRLARAREQLRLRMNHDEARPSSGETRRRTVFPVRTALE